MGQADKAKVRLRDVAAAAGVSQGTASNVFSRPDIVREEVREHVRAVARSLGYEGPDLRGKLLSVGKVNAIGVATAEPLSYFFEDPWARHMMAALAAECDARGAGLALISARDQRRTAWNLQSALVDGFVLLCAEETEEFLVGLTRRRALPFVALSTRGPGADLPAIGIDNRGGAHAAAAHLAGLCHRRLAVLGVEISPGPAGPFTAGMDAGRLWATTRERLLGYRDAFAEAGIDPSAVPFVETASDAESVGAAMAWLFDRPEPPTGLLVMSDKVALLAMKWLSNRGLAVPGDVSVVGFDGVPDAAGATPALTSVAQPYAQIAALAIGAIIDDRVPDQAGKLPLKLVVRKSTAAPART
jgi:DNA-binding LacI/PurR family transcriptional regulator